MLCLDRPFAVPPALYAARGGRTLPNPNRPRGRTQQQCSFVRKVADIVLASRHGARWKGDGVFGACRVHCRYGGPAGGKHIIEPVAHLPVHNSVTAVLSISFADAEARENGVEHFFSHVIAAHFPQ